MLKENWLNNNIASLLALIWTSFSLVLYIMVLTKAIVATENVAFLIINSVTNILMIIVGYFFGSSLGSKTKQATLDKMNENTSSITTSIKDNTIPNDNQ